MRNSGQSGIRANALTMLIGPAFAVVASGAKQSSVSRALRPGLPRRYAVRNDRDTRQSAVRPIALMRNFLIRIAVAVTICALPGTGHAQNAVLQEAIGLFGQATFLKIGAPGMVLVVVRGNDHIVMGYGKVAKDHDAVPDGRSLFRIGSVSKAFTGELLGSMAADGTIRLTAPLADYAPPSARLPEAGGRPITLLDLATHTAGLPRDLPDDKYNGEDWKQTAVDRFDYLAGLTLLWPPGTGAAYSNLGFNLLGDALVQAGKHDYEALLRSRIADPLGMADTTAAPNAEQCARLMIGGGLTPAAPCRDTRSTAASGGLYSTGNDMAIWLAHNLSTDKPATWTTLALTQAVYRQRATLAPIIGLGGMDGMALGWEFVAASGHTPALLDKNGATDGFLAQATIAPGRGVGVFLVVNQLDFTAFGAMAEAARSMIETLAVR